MTLFFQFCSLHHTDFSLRLVAFPICSSLWHSQHSGISSVTPTLLPQLHAVPEIAWPQNLLYSCIIHYSKATTTWITLPGLPASLGKMLSRAPQLLSRSRKSPGLFSFESLDLAGWASIPLFQCKSDLSLIVILSLTIIASFQHIKIASFVSSSNCTVCISCILFVLFHYIPSSFTNKYSKSQYYAVQKSP